MEMQALSRYASVVPILEAGAVSEGEDASAQYESALGVLIEIADYATLLSHRWADAPPVPGRETIEFLIRVDDVGGWSAELGHPLSLEQPVLPDYPWLDQQPNPNGDQEGNLALQVAALLQTRAKLVEVRRLCGTEPISEDEAAASGKQSAVKLLADTRSWMVWSRRNLPIEAHPAAMAAVCVARGMFIEYADPRSPIDRPLFPSRNFLRELLVPTGAAEWLRAEGEEIPAWLM
jgi:hypothetical protein